MSQWSMRIADFPVPDTVAARGALELATSYQSAAITAHALRSWLWAEAFAVVEGLADVDHEILYVSAVLHDIGTVTEFDAHTVSYEHAGGHVGVALTAGAGWPAARRQRVLDAIVRHNWPSVDPELDVEGHLLEVATGLDISGARADALPEEYLREVLAVHPRGDLAAEFGACVVDQAERKPATAARRLVDGGIIAKLAANPLEALR
ncbi:MULTISPECIES: HD domain-containing protein [Clavibacter]|nr:MULTISPECIES: HD domain-containing protein [Clavibacter]UKF25744.1 HD domain-containing protein [Clavibacter sp. A6099]